MKISNYVRRRLLGMCLVLMALPFAPAGAVSPEGQAFASPQAAAEALVAALRSQDASRILGVLGGQSHELVLSGDSAIDLTAWERFVKAYELAHKVEMKGQDAATLVVGKNDYPFPVPLHRKAGNWQFDAASGVEEVINRRIGYNETTTIEVLRQVVLAQDEYFLRARPGRAPAQYAGRFGSTPGQQDGLYWPVAAGERPSPLGPLVAQAEAQGYPRNAAAYAGYRYRMLPAQGAAARGGARQYVVNGLQIGGFAVLAWPAQYGVTGVVSFIVNQDGQVLQRDLGWGTEQEVEKIKTFNPVKGWQPVEAAPTRAAR